MMSIVDGDNSPHLPVLYHETINALCPQRSGKYIDGTVGAGGHAAGILEASSPDGLLLGLDIDPQALDLAGQRLSAYGERAIVIHASYTTLKEQAKALGWDQVQGILIDLGVSSMQLDTADRGFSFRTDGPLDMRFDPSKGKSAADLVNLFSEQELANIFWRYGEERKSRRIANAICRERPLHTTLELADLVVRSVGMQKGRVHPATRVFQALRIAVNDELQKVESVLPDAVSLLAPEGRLAIITFHSLEDRIVKQYFRHESRDCICPPQQPVCTCNHKALLREITRKPIFPEKGETEKNPRARSAHLRVAEKLKVA